MNLKNYNACVYVFGGAREVNKKEGWGEDSLRTFLGRHFVFVFAMKKSFSLSEIHHHTTDLLPC